MMMTVPVLTREGESPNPKSIHPVPLQITIKIRHVCIAMICTARAKAVMVGPDVMAVECGHMMPVLGLARRC